MLDTMRPATEFLPDAPTTPKTARLFSPVQGTVVVALLAAYAVLAWLGRRPIGLGSSDELAYLALSRSIEAGTYRELFQVGAPWHVQYPPAYPAWLFVVRHATGERIGLIPAVNIALVVISLVVFLLCVRRFLGAWLAIALLAVLVPNPSLLADGGTMLSEAFFLLLSTGALAAALAADRASGESRARRVHVAIALALLAFLTRSVGLALVGGIGVWLLRARVRRELLIYSISSLLVVGAWFGYTALAPRSVLVSSYGQQFTSDLPSHRPSAVATFAQRVVSNARAYAASMLHTELSLPAVQGTYLDDIIWLAALVLGMAIGVALLWNAWRASAAYLVFYALLLLAWTWPMDRYLSPVVPLALFTIVIGMQRVLTWFSPRVSNTAIATLLVLFASGSAKGMAIFFEQHRGCEPDKPYATSGCFTPEISSMALASEYVRDHAARGDAVLASRASAVAFLSGHLSESARLVTRVPKDRVATALQTLGIRYVLLTSDTDFERGPLARKLVASCGDLQTEARFPAQTLLLRTTSPGDAGVDACADLRDYQRETERIYGRAP